MKRVLRAPGVFAILLVVAALGSGIVIMQCDGDNPVKPQEPEDYVVWSQDASGTGKYYGFHVATGLVDSFYLSFHAVYGMDVSADGKRLFAYADEGTGIIDLEEQVLEEVIPVEAYKPIHGVVFSADGRYVAFQGQAFDILTYPDLQPVYHDTLEVQGGCFSQDGDHFYAVATQTGLICTVDLLAQGTTIHDRVFELRPLWVAPTADETKWLLYLHGLGDFGFFTVYDPAADSVIFKDFLRPAWGQLASGSDSRFALYSQPGIFSEDYPPPCHFTVFDIEANRIDRLISTTGFIDGVTPSCVYIDFVWCSPDGEWVVAADKWGEYILVYDTRTLKLVNWYKPEGIHLLGFTGPSG